MFTLWLVLLLAIAVARTESQQSVTVPEKPTIQPPDGLPYFKSTSFSPIQCITNLTEGQLIYKFYKNGTLVKTMNWNGYSLYQPNSDDSGNYTCTVSNSAGESLPSDGVYMIFVDVPRITASREDAEIGDEIILTCNVSLLVPYIEFSWFKGYAEIAQETTKIYKIAKIVASDEGEYSCRFTIKNSNDASAYSFASDKSERFAIVLSAPSKPTLDSFDDQSQGQFLSLSCSANSASSAAGLELSYLYFNGVEIAQTLAGSDIGMFSQGQLLFRDTGNYACAFSNKKGKSPLSQPFRISVKAWTPDPGNFWITELFRMRGQINYISSMPYRMRFNIYYCTFYINGDRYLDDQDCSLQIPNEISGNYTYSVASVNSSGPIGPPMVITFFSKPYIRPLSQEEPVLYQNYSLQCVTDLIGASIYWYKNDSQTPVASKVDILSFNLQDPLDDNRYRCKILLGGDEYWSDYYTLYLSPPSAPTLSGRVAGTNQLAAIQFTNSFQFKCDGKNAKLYTLYKNGVRVVTAGQSSGDFLIFRSGKSGAYYTCTASNKLGESEHSNPVYVSGKDEVVLIASTPKAEVGQSLTLTCSVQNTTESSIIYKWIIYRPNIGKTSIPPEERIEQNLIFNPVTTNDEGLYTCEAEFDGKAISASNYYTINTAPPMKSEINDMKIGPPNEQIFSDSLPSGIYYRFSCTCKGISCDPKNPFRLYKDGIEVRNIPFKDVLDFLQEFVIQRFYIVDITAPENEGSYTCTATNSFGESEHSYEVRVSGTQEFPVPKVSADNLNATLGQSITFTCDVPSRILDFQVEWSKSNNAFFRTGRTLTLQSLAREDDGRYSCKYSNRTSLDNYNYIEILSDSLYLTLREPLQPLLVLDVDEQENIYRTYDDSGAVYFMFGVGDTVHLRCKTQRAFSNQYPSLSENVITFSLYKNGQEVARSKLNGKFEITGLPLGTYNYTCRASNNIGDSPYSYPLSVNIIAKPSISASSVSPIVGNNLTLTCNTKQVSDGSDIIWKKNGKILPQTSPELNFIRLSQYDEGKYACRQKIDPWYHPKSDEYNLAFGTVAVTPDIFTLNPTTLDFGSPLKLYCLTASSTSYQAVFYKNGNVVRTVDTGEYDSAGQILYTYSVLYATSDDSGDYTCTIASSQGVSQRSDILTISFVCGSNFHNPDCAQSCNCNLQNSICNKNGTCDCLLGWEDTTCNTDIDECQRNAHDCASYTPYATCHNIQGGYECVCPPGYRNSNSKICEAEFKQSFEIRFPHFFPTDSMLIQGSEEYTALAMEIQNAVNLQLQQRVKGFLTYVITDLRRGSLIVEGEVILDKEVNKNAGGEFIKALTSLHISTVNGTEQNDTIITIAGIVVTPDLNQCEVREKTDPCSDSTTCVTDNESVSQCQKTEDDDSTDMYFGIGIGVGVGILLIIGLTFAICYRYQHKVKLITHYVKSHESLSKDK